MSRPRVVYWNNIPSPYMVDRLNAVADRGNLDLEAWFSRRVVAGRSWAIDEQSWRFPYRYLPALQLGRVRLEIPMGLLSRRRPDLLFSLYADASCVLGTVLARMGGTKYAYWVEVTFDALVPRSRWKETLKRVLLSRADGILTVGDDGRSYAMRYGAQPSRIHLAPHAINVGHFAAGAALGRADRDAFRTTLGLRGFTFLYVGRLWTYGKGLDTLLDAYAQASARVDEPVSLLLVGDGADDAELRARVAALRLQNVVFAGFQPEAALPRYYAASDVFVFPTRGDTYGLVLDEAMACSLPLISSDAAGELYLRIQDGVNGHIVPVDDSARLAEVMAEMAMDPERCRDFGRVSRLMVEGRTPERWAIDFERAVAAVLNAGASA